VRHLILIALALLSFSSKAQISFGYGYSVNTSAYAHFKNPDGQIGNQTAGQVLPILGSIGPKLWITGEKVGFSIEALAELKPVALNIQTKGFQGIGAISFPFMSSLAVALPAISSTADKTIVAVSGGVQFNKTELFFRGNNPTTHDWFRTYVGEVSLGVGTVSVQSALFLRMGFGERNARTYAFGIKYDFDRIAAKNLTEE